jgi:hypothetical protein
MPTNLYFRAYTAQKTIIEDVPLRYLGPNFPVTYALIILGLIKGSCFGGTMTGIVKRIVELPLQRKRTIISTSPFL